VVRGPEKLPKPKPKRSAAPPADCCLLQ
jgi:hypothetical protein